MRPADLAQCWRVIELLDAELAACTDGDMALTRVVFNVRRLVSGWRSEALAARRATPNSLHARWLLNCASGIERAFQTARVPLEEG